jgi:hypothetical protein
MPILNIETNIFPKIYANAKIELVIGRNMDDKGNSIPGMLPIVNNLLERWRSKKNGIYPAQSTFLV